MYNSKYCVSDCPKGYYEKSSLGTYGTCEKCDSTCAKCSGPLATNCVECVAGKFINDSNQCDSCDSKCSFCSGSPVICFGC